LKILESRLDNVVYRVGFASSRAEARQLIGHGHFEVNGARVDIASYLLKAGDVISICEKSSSLEKIKSVLEANASRPAPQWIDVDKEKNTAKVIALPERDQIDAPIEEQPIVEFYSK
jgi:small subunit ribosomal protein S4